MECQRLFLPLPMWESFVNEQVRHYEGEKLGVKCYIFHYFLVFTFIVGGKVFCNVLIINGVDAPVWK